MSIVDEEPAAIIGDNAKAVMASPVDSDAACPTHSEVIASVETWPIATCVAIVHVLWGKPTQAFNISAGAQVEVQETPVSLI